MNFANTYRILKLIKDCILLNSMVGHWSTRAIDTPTSILESGDCNEVQKVLFAKLIASFMVKHQNLSNKSISGQFGWV